jgi:hypothetical protein
MAEPAASHPAPPRTLADLRGTGWRYQQATHQYSVQIFLHQQPRPS